MGIQITQNFSSQISAINSIIYSAVLNAMEKTFYVDAANGNDNNDGSQTAPFKTLKKAVDSVPVGGYGIIRLAAGLTYTIDSDIYLNNKRIFIIGNEGNKPTIKNSAYINDANNSTATYGFIINNSQLCILFCDIITADYVNGTTGLYYYGEGFIKRTDYTFGSFQLMVGNITLGDTDLIRLPNGASMLFIDLWNVNIIRAGRYRNAYLVVNEAGNYGLGSQYVAIRDSAGNSLTWNDVLYGIVKDVNGVPRNVISNVIL